MSKNIYVGMSGGVDSSVTAAVLKKQGYSVTGVYMKNWAQDLPGFKCPWKEDYNDAKRVAVQLGIPFKIYDFQKQYRQKVVDYMIEKYKAGVTPNPDIMCNQEIKFKLFLETALEDGADLIATGHYSQIMQGPSLHKGEDEGKDQSYFLYRMDKHALSKTLFPLGNMKKNQVRKTAKELGLITHDKKDSQGICFVGEIGIKEFLQNFVKTKTGPIINQDGEELGQHEGALFYTIGQRQGLGIGGGKRYYVTGKDMDKNIVYVTSKINDKKLWSREIEIFDTHWINKEPSEGKKYEVRIRHLGPLVFAELKKKGKNWLAKLEKEQRAIASGQSMVIYDGERVLGGGIIA